MSKPGRIAFRCECVECTPGQTGDTDPVTPPIETDGVLRPSPRPPSGKKRSPTLLDIIARLLFAQEPGKR